MWWLGDWTLLPDADYAELNYLKRFLFAISSCTLQSNWDALWAQITSKQFLGLLKGLVYRALGFRRVGKHSWFWQFYVVSLINEQNLWENVSRVNTIDVSPIHLLRLILPKTYATEAVNSAFTAFAKTYTANGFRLRFVWYRQWTWWKFWNFTCLSVSIFTRIRSLSNF